MERSEYALIRTSAAWFTCLLVVSVGAGAHAEPSAGAIASDAAVERRAAAREAYRADLFELRGTLASLGWI
jgi:hypothetical protein